MSSTRPGQSTFRRLDVTSLHASYLSVDELPIRSRGQPIALSDFPNDVGFITSAAVVQSDLSVTDASSPAFVRGQRPLAAVAYSGLASDLIGAIQATNMQADWLQGDSTSGSFVRNKPQLAAIATSGRFDALLPSSGQPTIPLVADASITGVQGTRIPVVNLPAPPVQMAVDWLSTDQGSLATIRNRPTLATVATSGAYGDLQGKPTVYTSVDWNLLQNSGTTLAIRNQPTIPPPQQNSNWTSTGGVTQILNLPTTQQFQQQILVQPSWTETNANSYAYITGKPTIPAAQVASDWNATSGVSQILNRPALGKAATSNLYGDLQGLPTIPAAQVPTNWAQSDTSKPDYLLNRPTWAPVAYSGKYSDLQAATGQPAIPNLVDWQATSSTSTTLAVVNKPQFTTPVQSDYQQTDSAQLSYIRGKPQLATVAVSGSYTDLLNVPPNAAAQQQADYGQTDSTSVTYIKGKPALAAVATSGRYDALLASSGQPASYLYADWAATSSGNGALVIYNKPTIPAAQVQSDYAQTDNTQLSYIKNRPTFATVATSGSYSDLSNTPTIAQQIQADWAQADTTRLDFIKNKPTLAAVATSGRYDSLTAGTGQPTVPTSVSWAANASTATTLYISGRPTALSAFTNDSGFYSSGSTASLASLTVSGPTIVQAALTTQSITFSGGVTGFTAQYSQLTGVPTSLSQFINNLTGSAGNWTVNNSGTLYTDNLGPATQGGGVFLQMGLNAPYELYGAVQSETQPDSSTANVDAGYLALNYFDSGRDSTKPGVALRLVDSPSRPRLGIRARGTGSSTATTDGDLDVGTLTASRNLSVAGTSTLTGATTAGAITAGSLAASGAISGGTISGAVSATSLSASGTTTLQAVSTASLASTGTISGPVSASSLQASGATTLQALTATALNASGSTTLQGGLTVSGTASFTSPLTLTNASVSGTLSVAGPATMSGSLAVSGTTSLTGALTVAAGASLQAPYVLCNATSNGSSQTGTVGPGDRFLLQPPASGIRPFAIGFNAAQVRSLDAVSGQGIWYTMPGNLSGTHRFEVGSTVYLEVGQTGVTAPQGALYVTNSSNAAAGLVSEPLGGTSATVLNTQVNFRGITTQANPGASARIDTRSALPFQWQYRAAGSSTETLLAQLDSSGNFSTSGTVSTTGGVSGAVAATTLSASGATTLGSTLSVSGATTAAGVSCSSLTSTGNISGPHAATTLSASGAATLSSTLAVSGATTLSSTLAITGATTAAAISCSSLTTTGTTTLGSTLAVSGATTLSSTLAITGATTAAAISCSSLTTTGTTTLGTVNVASLTVGNSFTCTPNAAFSQGLMVTGATTTNGITNTGAVTSSSVQISATASGQSAEKVYGSGGSGVTVSVDWSTFTPSTPSPLPAWRWLLTDAGNGSSSLVLQVAPGPQSSNSVMSTALTLAAGTGNAMFTQPFTLGSTLSVSGAATMGSISAAAITVAGQTTLNGAMTCAGNATLSSNLAVNQGLTVTGTSSMTGAVTIAAASSLQAPYVLSNATGSGVSQNSTVGPGDRFLLSPPVSGSRPFGLGFNSAQVRVLDAVSGSGVWYTMPGNVSGSHRFELGSTVYLEVSQTGVTAPQGSFYVNGSGSPLAGLVTEVPTSSSIVVNTQVNYRGVTAQANAGAAARIDTRGTFPFQWLYRAAGSSTETQLAQIDSSGNLSMLAGVNAAAISATVVTATTSTVYLGNSRAGIYRTGGANPVTYLQANDTITPDTTLVGGAFLVDSANSRFSWQARAANSSTDTTLATLSFTTGNFQTTGNLQASGGFAGPVAATTLSASAAATLSSTLAVSGATTTAGIANTGTLSSTGAISGPVAATTLSASGAATLSSTLSVSGATTAAGVSCSSLTSTGNISGPIAATTLSASGAATLNSTLAVAGATTLSGALAVSGATTAAALSCTTLSASGAAALNSTLTVTGTSAFTGNLSLINNATPSLSMVNNVGNSGQTTCINMAGYTGFSNGYPLTLTCLDNNYSADLVVYTKTPGAAANSQVERFRVTNTGVVNVAGPLNVAGAATLSSTLSVSGATTAAGVSCSSLTSTGNISGPIAATTLSASGAATLNSTFAVAGATTLSGTLAVSGATTAAALGCTTLTASGAATLNSTLAVTGATTLSGTLAVSGATTAAALGCTTLTASGAATLNSTLAVSGAATLGGTLAVTGTSAFTGNLSLVNGATPSLSMVNVSGNSGQTACINMAGYTGFTNGAPLTVTCLDNNYSADLVVYTKTPGAAANAQVERFRVTNAGVVNVAGPLNVAGAATLNSTLSVGTATNVAPLTVQGDVMFGANAGVPTSIANEVGGTTPVVNLSINFREANKNTAYLGGALRMDSRNSQFWQFIYRAANSTAENLVASLSSAGVLSTGYHYITGVDANSRSLVNLASGNSANSLVWGQALTANNSAVLTYQNNTASTVFLGIYGSAGLTVDANANVTIPGTVRSSSQFSTTSNVNTVAPSQGTNGGAGDRFVLWPGSSSTYPYALGINSNTLWYNVPGQASHTFCVNGSVIGCVNSTGVGILNTAPAYPLDVSGQARVIATGTNQIQIVNPSTTNTNDACEINFNRAAVSSSLLSAVGIGAGGRGAYWWVNGSDRITINPSNGAVNVVGALSKGSGTFQIRHPLAPETTDLVHSFVEGPRCDLIYRGRTKLTAGVARVEIDAECTGNGRGMREGTFVALCRNPQVYLQNNVTWAKVMGHVEGGTLYVCCEDPAADCLIDWMVVAERQDDHVRKWDKTDSEGHLVLEWDR